MSPTKPSPNTLSIRSLLLVTLLILAMPVSAQAPQAEAQLAALSRASVVAANDFLVNGNAEAALGRAAAAASLRPAFDRQLPTLRNRRGALTGKGFSYASHRTELAIDGTEVDGDQAVQRGTEKVVFELRGGGPAQTEYEQQHVFRFARQGDDWVLVSDELVTPPPLEEEISAPSDAPPLRDAPPGFKPDPARRQPPQGGPTQAEATAGSRPMLASWTAGQRDVRLAASASYNATAAVSYALTYWSNYNSSYRVYSSNDCTNFTSQALTAGGWPEDESGSRTGSDTWYYGTFTATTSYSWAGAHNFNLFFKQSGRGFVADYFSQLIKGDLVQADWAPTDGNISHSMVVTDVSNGTAFLTYHSTNTKNRSLDEMRASFPGTSWYGLLMYSTFSY